MTTREEFLQTLQLAHRRISIRTAREAEALLWVSRGKTSRDIGDILGMAARTMNKHLEHPFRKLHVETRAAAAVVAVAVALKTRDRA
jgi:DNA-binding CsgD family transcriptional regulator